MQTAAASSPLVELGCGRMPDMVCHMRATVLLAALVLLASCDEAGPVSNPTTATSFPAPSTKTATTLPLTAAARKVFRLDDPGAFRSTDEPCPVLDEDQAESLLPNRSWPAVSLSYAEGGGAIFLLCRWGDSANTLQISANWIPNEVDPRFSQLEAFLRDEIDRQVSGIGVVAGFTTTGEFSALLNDGVYLTIASSVLTDDQLYEIIPSVVSKL